MPRAHSHSEPMQEIGRPSRQAVGAGVTDMISEAVLGRKLETTGHEVLKAVHPHPTMSEAVMEAVADAYDEVIHL